MKPEYFLIAAVVLIAIVAIANSKKGKDKPATPEPVTNRTDLLFGYFGVLGDQVEQTRDHTNLLWLWDFLTATEAADFIEKAPGKFCVLDLAPYLWTPRPQRPREDAEQAIRECFTYLRGRGVLGQIKMLVPLDEPNIGDNRSTLPHLTWAAALMRRVAGEFPELQGVLLGCVYSGWEDMPHLGLWDVAGLNYYRDRERIFAPGGKYHQMRAQLRPEQRTMIFPGGYAPIRQDPAPFVAFAHANPEVLAVIAFLWPSPPWAEDVEKGIADMPDVREKYVAAGLSIVNKGA